MAKSPFSQPSSTELNQATRTSPPSPPTGREPWTTTGLPQPPTLSASRAGADQLSPLSEDAVNAMWQSPGAKLSNRVAVTYAQPLSATSMWVPTQFLSYV